MVVYNMVELKNFLEFISENYSAEISDGDVELVPFNEQYKIIKNNNFDKQLSSKILR